MLSPLLLLLFLLVAVQAAEWGCGDGILDRPLYGEQCDPGIRCVTQNNTLRWVGIGSSLGAKFVSVRFKYSVSDYFAPSLTMPVYGLEIWQGPTPSTALKQTVVFEYILVCQETTNGNDIATITLQPATGFASQLLSASVRWSYQSATCSAFFQAQSPPSLTLSGFMFTWLGSLSTRIWRLDQPSVPNQLYRMLPNNNCGTMCCNTYCYVTRESWVQSVCTYSDAPTSALVQGVDYLCQPNGTCLRQLQRAQTTVPVGCGNGIVEPGEECDSGMYCETQAVSSGPYSVVFSFQYVPSGTAIYNYQPADTSGSGSVPIPLGNNTYFWNCSKPTTTILRLAVIPGPGYVAPALYMQWEYTVPIATDCSNYDWLAMSGMTFARFGAAYLTAGGTLIYFNSTSPSQKFNTAYCGTDCCKTNCNIDNSNIGDPCPDDTPLTWPRTTGYFCTNGVCGPTPSATPTSSPSNTPSRTASPSGTGTRTPTRSGTGTRTPTPSRTASPSATRTPTGTPSPSNTASVTGTPSITSSSSETPTPSITSSPSETPTPSITSSPSETPTPSITASPSQTGTPSITSSPSETPTPSITSSPSESQTPSNTPSVTSTQTPSPTALPTTTPTTSPSESQTPSITSSPSESQTPSATSSPSESQTPSATSSPSESQTPSITSSPSESQTPSITSSPSESQTPTMTGTPSLTSLPTNTPTATSSPSLSNTPSITATASMSSGASQSPTMSATPTPSETTSPTAMPTTSPTSTGTGTQTRSGTQTNTPTRSPSRTPGPTPAPSDNTLWIVLGSVGGTALVVLILLLLVCLIAVRFRVMYPAETNWTEMQTAESEPRRLPVEGGTSSSFAVAQASEVALVPF